MLGAAAVVLCACQAGAGTSSPSAPPTSASAARTWVMPNLVGTNLQRAQDRIQAITGDPLFLTSSHDASGRQRFQVRDADWRVCTQNVAPGTRFGMHAKIDFGAVKLTESCP